MKQEMHPGVIFAVSIVILASVIGVLLFQWKELTKVSPEPLPSSQNEEKAAEPVFVPGALDESDVETIRTLAAGGMRLTQVEEPEGWQVPEGLDPRRMTVGAQATPDVAFAFVQQPSMNIPLHGVNRNTFEQFAYTGVLFTRDGGKTWRSAFSVPPVMDESGIFVAYNPIGMQAKGGVYLLDVLDAAGAGSGEGQLVRFSTTDGRFWTRVGCFYMVPETYDEDLTAEPEACATYATQLPFPVVPLNNLNEEDLPLTIAPATYYQQYENPSFHFFLSYPANWFMAAYHVPGESSIVANAFDPFSVYNQEQYETTDGAPGTMWMYVTDGLPDSASTASEVVVGEPKAGVTAKYWKQTYGADDQITVRNRTIADYYIELPESLKTDSAAYLVIEISYPNSLADDVELQKILNEMLNSFGFDTL